MSGRAHGPTSGPNYLCANSLTSEIESRWGAQARGDNGILEAVISPEVFIPQSLSGFTRRTLWKCLIMAA